MSSAFCAALYNRKVPIFYTTLLQGKKQFFTHPLQSLGKTILCVWFSIELLMVYETIATVIQHAHVVIAEELKDEGFKHTLVWKDSDLYLLSYLELYNNCEERCSNPQYHSSVELTLPQSGIKEPEEIPLWFIHLHESRKSYILIVPVAVY